MKKLLLISSIVAISFADVLLPKKDAMNVLNSTKLTKKILEAQNTGKLKIVGVSYNNDFYVIGIKTNNSKGYVYLTRDKKYLIMGNVLSTETGLPFKSKAIKLINAEKVKEGVSFVGGNPNAKKEIYIVTDPECPFCRRLELEQGNLLRKNYKINYILFPLSFHKNAKAMSYYILAGKTNKEKEKRLEEVMRGSDKWRNYKLSQKEKEKIDRELEKAKEAVKELGAKGTPSIYDSNFNSVR